MITGDKAWITHGPVADFFLVAARTGDDRLARHQHLPGARRRAGGQRRRAGAEDGLPRLASPAPCTSTTVRVAGRPADRRRGPGFPDRDVRAGLRPARASPPARSGWPRRRSTSAADYAGERTAFGRPIDEFQGVSFLLADAAAGIAAARQLYLYAARRKDAGQPFSTEAAMAKLIATDMAMAVTTDMVQVLGGAGYVEDHPLERYMREAKVLQIVEGTNQIQRMVIARSLHRHRGDLDERRMRTVDDGRTVAPGDGLHPGRLPPVRRGAPRSSAIDGGDWASAGRQSTSTPTRTTAPSTATGCR